MTDSPAEGLRTSYDAVAQAYERRYGEELQHQPLDRALLRVFADEVGPTSVVGDVGCGPGHITAHLHELGLRPVGVRRTSASRRQPNAATCWLVRGDAQPCIASISLRI
jgi:hypothetical protein